MNKKSICNEIKQETTEKKNRANKLAFMKKNGFNFPNSFKRSHTADLIHRKYKTYTRDMLKTNIVKVNIAGRVMQKRIMGKSSFITLKDVNTLIQIYYKKKCIESNIYLTSNDILDIGDILGIEGYLFRTKTKELSVYCENIILLTKSVNSFPDKFHGLSNKELCYRKRHLDLITNKKTFFRFQQRSYIVSKIRSFMEKNHFLEVETPIMQNVPGGANARPFITYHNSLDIDIYLRIAPELYLKRLIIGGFDKIFEINKSFRNEGVSVRHNPEFTMMEAYMAYHNYKDAMKFIENLFLYLCTVITGTYAIEFNKHVLNFKNKFKVISMKESILLFNSNIRFSDLNNYKKLKNISLSLGIKKNKQWGIGKLLNEIFEKTVEKKLIEPTFIVDYPTEVSPLAKNKRNTIEYTERFELFIGGYEIANGFSELNDSEEQKNRFLQQKKYYKNTKQKKFFYDSSYINALEYGLPPTAGLGIGIDRLVMLFTNQKNIRDVILFPVLRPKNFK
ncbi:Lysine--tRNA ligase [Buchnera aphidicola (Anoecia corni)]|uniref:Lysine--tRNA ligase n=1 Tax=Buchnera aphidicola (Anoecia corni) TaxID=2994477 RepID=A0AAT9IGR8_9GAMM